MKKSFGNASRFELLFLVLSIVFISRKIRRKYENIKIVKMSGRDGLPCKIEYWPEPNRELEFENLIVSC